MNFRILDQKVLVEEGVKNYEFVHKILAKKDAYEKDFYLDRICCGFLHFLQRAKQSPTQCFQPSFDVHFVWHTYMLLPDIYANESKLIFGTGRLLDYGQFKLAEKPCKFQMHELGTSLKFLLEFCLFDLDIVIDTILPTLIEYCEITELIELYAEKISNVLRYSSDSISYDAFKNQWLKKYSTLPFFPEIGGSFSFKDLLDQVNLFNNKNGINRNYKFVYIYDLTSETYHPFIQSSKNLI